MLVLQTENILCMQGTPIKKIVKYATARGFTDVMVFNENQKHVNGLLLIHLPGGPTAHFKLSSLKLSKDIKVSTYHFAYSCLLKKVTVQAHLNLVTFLACLEGVEGIEGNDHVSVRGINFQSSCCQDH